jgi:predicted AAA+ superfamily ATPase
VKIDHHIRHWALDRDFLHNRMSFICGPRQIGKTTLIRNHLEKSGSLENYHNWDTMTLRQKFASNPLFFIEDLPFVISPKNKISPEKREWIAFDEIHKYPKWKDLLKGYYDEFKDNLSFIVTGSARLDYMRRSGDSLIGRYFLSKMHPLHPNDLVNTAFDKSAVWEPHTLSIPFRDADKAFQAATAHLYNLTGFPEPVTVGTKTFYERWKNNHISLITGEDIRDLSKITNIQKLQTLVFLLPERVGAPLSLNNMKNILSCAHSSVQNWLEALKNVYLVFSIPPYTGLLKRSVRKEEKYYLWDWGILSDPGKRFENFLAVQLQRAVSAWTEWGLGDYNLMFVRTKDGREVDFVITESNTPCLLIESKKSGKILAPGIKYFKDRLKIPIAFQVIEDPGYLKQADSGVFIIGIDRLLQILP